ncbi:19095_t:CDS:2 [Dentiscutata erythropus]|uniref:19095_t:CDS:1 n=1 Tax=Dentiscutata erythropus TaxID=1348616 RepID=A0A9N9DQD4_9GLOM|nr:19095_t:CDS:2 [Dentiscutata erythropus]
MLADGSTCIVISNSHCFVQITVEMIIENNAVKKMIVEMIVKVTVSY